MDGLVFISYTIKMRELMEQLVRYMGGEICSEIMKSDLIIVDMNELLEYKNSFKNKRVKDDNWILK